MVLMSQFHPDLTVFAAVFHGVIRQVVDHLMDFPLGGRYPAISLHAVGQLRALLLGQQAHHPHDLFQHRSHLHRLRCVQKVAVQPGQAQQVLGDAAEPLRLAADVRHKIPDCLHIHLVCLQNGIRQQPDGSQRRFQLMAGVGHKPAAQGLRGLKPIRQAVEFLSDLGDLVPAGDVGPMLVGAGPDLADGRQQGADLPGQHPGEQDAQQHHRRRDTGGQLQEVALQSFQQCRLLCVIFVGVHRADDPVLIQHRRGRAAAEGPVPVGAGKGVISLQCLHDLGIEGVLSNGAAGLPGIVEHQTGAVRHQNSAESRLLHHCHGSRHVFLIQPVQARQRIHHHRHAAGHIGLLGAEHQILADQQRIGVQQKQHRRDDGDVAQSEFDLQAAPEGHAPALGSLIL